MAAEDRTAATSSLRQRWRARRAARSICVVSTPDGFSVVGADWTPIERFPFARGLEAFTLADALDPRGAARV